MVVGKHYCKDNIVDIAFFGEVEPCCKNPDKMPPRCCHDEYASYQVEEEYSGSDAFVFVPLTLDLDLLPVVLDLLPVNEIEKQQLKLHNHSPPDLHPDIYKWVESYLI